MFELIEFFNNEVGEREGYFLALGFTKLIFFLLFSRRGVKELIIKSLLLIFYFMLI